MGRHYKQEKVSKKNVYYTGTATLKEGYPLCYERDSTTGGTLTGAQIDRAYRVEQPAAGNLRQFAGFVAKDQAAAGPCWLEIVLPSKDLGTICNAWTMVSCTGSSVGGATVLGIVGSTWTLKAGGSTQLPVAIANQTKDTGSTPGLVQVMAFGPMAHAIAATTAGGIGKASAAILLVPTGGTTGGTYAFENVQGGTGCTAGTIADIENNFAKIGNVVDEIVADIAAIKTHLENANLMG